MRGLRNLRNKNLTVMLLVICMMAMLTGCGGSSKESAASTASRPAAMANGSTMDMVAEEAYLEMGSVDGGTELAVEAEAKKVEESTGSVLRERKLIKTVDMNVETQEFDALLDTIESRVEQLEGYIENMNTYNGSAYRSYRETRSADMVIRIPKNQLNNFLDTVAGNSNVIRRSDDVKDVTLAYVDLESHRDALRTEQTRLLELLEKAESIEDIITIEQRLSEVRYQLESMESQLRTYDNQVDYSTVYLSIEEVEVYTPVKEETVWERISFGFVDSLNSIGEGFVEFGIWFVINIPYMIVWAVVIIVMILVIRGVAKRNGKKKDSTTENKNEVK